MTLPSSGAISIAQIAAELGIGLPLSSVDGRVLALAGKSAPPVTMPSDFYGKSASGAPTPFSVSKLDASGSAITTSVAGTVSCAPQVSETGGTPPYARTWSFTSNPNGCALSNTNAIVCTVSHTFAKLSDGEATAILQCVSTDSAGASITTGNIMAYLEWSSNR